MESSVKNPKIPYTEVIPEGLQKNKCIKIQGNTTESTERFSINLQTGPNNNPRDDTGLHISVDFQKKCIMRNSYQDGNWDEAEGPGRLPIQIGQNFELIIYADSDHFKIGVNNKHYCDFFYRIPLNQLTHLVIDGNVTINLISWQENCDTLYSSVVPTQSINQEQIQVTPSQSDLPSLNLGSETNFPEPKKMEKTLLDEVTASNPLIKVLLNEVMKINETPTSSAQSAKSTTCLLRNQCQVAPEFTQNQTHSFLKGNLNKIVTVIVIIMVTLTSVIQFYNKLSSTADISSGVDTPRDLRTLKIVSRHSALNDDTPSIG